MLTQITLILYWEVLTPQLRWQFYHWLMLFWPVYYECTCFILQFMDIDVIITARFIRTVCMCRIRWSCEGLTSVHNEYTGYTLKHLLLRHMYNLSLLKLCATLLVGSLSLADTWQMRRLLLGYWLPGKCAHTVLCGALYSCLCRR